MVGIHSHIVREHRKITGSGLQSRVMFFLELVTFFGAVLQHGLCPPTSMQQIYSAIWVCDQSFHSGKKLF